MTTYSRPRQCRPRIMGIVNVTPDSFSDGGQFSGAQEAIAYGLRLLEEGADILDIGGESTRPGAEEVPVEQERSRVLPVIEALASKTSVPISIDSRKPDVAEAAVHAGASIWNDVSALTFDPSSLETAARLNCEIVLMHAKGSPATMQNDPFYDDVVSEVISFLRERLKACHEAGIKKNRLIADPGIGFGKNLDHNVALLANLSGFEPLGVPLLVGASRKRFIAALDQEGPGESPDRGPGQTRLGGSIAAAIIAAAANAAIVRVHDVAATRQALNVFSAVKAGGALTPEEDMC